MPAPRTCRNCGTALPADVRWCSMCSEAVREFHPRPVTETPFVGTPSHVVRTSRWRASDLTFGPRGRLAVTAIVFIVFFVGESGAGWISPFGLWFFMGWFILATMVLKTTWQKVRIDPDEPPGRRAQLAERYPGPSGKVSGSVVGLVVAVLAVTVAILAYWKVDQLGRFGILVLGVMTAVSVTLIWLTGV
jgi:hypothetical protein